MTWFTKGSQNDLPKVHMDGGGHWSSSDPLYVDVAIRRWEKVTKKHAVNSETGRTFAESEALLRAAIDAKNVAEPAVNAHRGLIQ